MEKDDKDSICSAIDRIKNGSVSGALRMVIMVDGFKKERYGIDREVDESAETPRVIAVFSGSAGITAPAGPYGGRRSMRVRGDTGNARSVL